MKDTKIVRGGDILKKYFKKIFGNRPPPLEKGCEVYVTNKS